MSLAMRRRLAGMLMVGSAGRSAGKTKFVCSLIERFSRQRDIIGVKVTAIEDVESGCPRGQSQCRVCSSLEGRYEIVEEVDTKAQKDTCRMLAAGASRVFWLRVLKEGLDDGAAALIETIGNDAVSVCESNSLGMVVEPGAFIMLEGAGGEGGKASAEKVMGCADRVVHFDGVGFDIDIDEIELADDVWAVKMVATAIIMAGGASVRMGRDKSMLPVGAEPMVKHIVNQLRPHFGQILVSSDDVSKYEFLDLEVVPDEKAGCGPLGGIVSALKASGNEVNFVVACDIPEVDIGLVKTMVREGRSYEAVVPKTGPERYEPLFAVYRKDVVGRLEGALESGTYRIMDALGDCNVRFVEADTAEGIKNLNTIEDYEEFVGEQKDDTV
jgi:molybdopterin-guanine dinucleotide biosynthesis protein A